MQHTQSRRQFLVRAAAGAVGAPLILNRSAWAYRGQPSERLTFGVIGCGGMGRANLNGFLRKPGTQVLAVCDPDTSRRDATCAHINSFYANLDNGSYQGCDTYNDYRELLARPDIDCVIISTPDHWHAANVIDAARAGKDIYGEKPLSLTIRQGRLMSDAVRRYARVFQTGSQQRSGQQFRYACELVRNGRIGELRTVTCGLPSGSTTGNHMPIPVPPGFDYDLWLGPARWTPYTNNGTHWNFRWILAYSGGQVTDWGAHHIDIAHWGMGTTETGPVAVEGVGEYPTDGLWDAATSYHFICTYANGVKMHVTNKTENGVKFVGSDGWVFVSRGRIDAEPKSLLTSVIAPSEIHLHPSGDHRQNFIDCVRSRREPIAPIEQAHRTVTVAHLGNIAMQLERPIAWDPRAERIVGDDQAQRMTDRALREPWRLS